MASQRPPAELVAYLDDALDLMQQYSINKKRIDWPAFRADVHQKTIAAHALDDMRLGIVYALGKLGDKHSYVVAPSVANGAVAASRSVARTPLAVGAIVAGRLAWIAMPSQFSGGDTAVAFSDQVQQRIAELDAQNPCGWIVDLRGILGSIWPGLAGLTPILGDGTLGAFVTADDQRVSWFASRGAVGTTLGTSTPVVRAAVTSAYRLQRSVPPVAVLLSTSTEGAGEAIAAAISGRPQTRSFGQQTAGVPTIDQGYTLSDGSTMYLTIAADADRTGRIFWPSAIEPDEVQPRALSYPLSYDDAAIAAKNWLLTMPACALSLF